MGLSDLKPEAAWAHRAQGPLLGFGAGGPDAHSWRKQNLTPRKIGVWVTESNWQPWKAKEPREGWAGVGRGRGFFGTYLLPPEHQRPAQPASPRTPTEGSSSFFPGSLMLVAMMCQAAWIQAQPLVCDPKKPQASCTSISPAIK